MKKTDKQERKKSTFDEYKEKHFLKNAKFRMETQKNAIKMTFNGNLPPQFR
jgi:hypothetical protein